MSAVAQVDQIRPFANNGEFLEAHFEEMRCLLKCAEQRRYLEKQRHGWGSEQEKEQPQDRPPDQIERHYQQMCASNEARYLATQSPSLPWRNLVAQCRLDAFDQQILWLLFFKAVSPDLRQLYQEADLESFGNERGQCTYVGNVLQILCPGSLLQQMDVRRHFSTEAPLVAHHLIELDSHALRYNSIFEVEVTITPRVISWISGDSHRYIGDSAFEIEHPPDRLEHIILPKEQLNRLLSIVENFDAYRQRRQELGLDRIVTYGRAVSLLEYGPPGTGKTLLARALANHTGRPLISLKASVSQRYQHYRNEGEKLRGLFREAQLQNGIVFIDECERLCGRTSDLLPHILAELERSDALVIMATNRPHELAPELDRRFTLKILFGLPDAQARRQIWEVHLQDVPLAADVDIEHLAQVYSLTGGYIKNAVLVAVNMALSGGLEGDFTLDMETLEEGARMQEKHTGNVSLYRRIVQPQYRLGDLPLSLADRERLMHLVRMAGNYPRVMRQWDFPQGPIAGCKLLLSGTCLDIAKRAVEGMAAELGVPVEQVCLGPFLKKPDSEYSPWTMEAWELFQALSGTGHLLVFIDEQQDLARLGELKETERGRAFFQEFAAYEGLAVLVTTGKQLRLPTWVRVFHEQVCLSLPDVEVRVDYWRKLLGNRVLNESGIDVEEMAQEYELSVEQIQRSVHRAALMLATEDKGSSLSREILEIAIRKEMRPGYVEEGALFG